MAQAFFGGVHPNDMKAATNEKAIEQLAPPAEVVIPMSMHFGAPCTPLVKAGDLVKVGQKIGETRGLGAPIHASVSGKVKAVEPRPYNMGGNMMAVVIENDFQDTLSEEVQAPANPDALSVEEMVEIVKNAGIVGQGGATFPTHVKISSGLGKVDYVIINAAECEPYITGDHRTCLERPEQVIKGATLLAKCFGVDKVYIGIEANKQNAADVLNAKIAELNAPVVVEVLHTRYPQGAEKQLVQAVSGRQVPSGKLPADAGCCIFNLNTTCAIYKAVYTGMPVVSKVVTVSGSGVIEPKNLECPIGTPITALFDAYARKTFPEALLTAGEPLPLFCDEVHTVVTDPEKSERVWKALRKKLSAAGLASVTGCWLSELPEAPMLLMRYLRKVFDSPRNIETHYADPDVLAVWQLGRKVSGERMRVLQFMRFQKTADGTYFGIMEPLYNVLSLTVRHFRDRFADQPWIIYDARRRFGYYYDRTDVSEITFSDPAQHPLTDGILREDQLDEKEKLFQDLWKSYFKTVCIRERLNPVKHRKDMPVRYWKYLTEKR